MLEERVRAHLREVRERKRTGQCFDTQGTKAFIQEQEAFLASMSHEIVDENKVTKGVLGDSHLLSQDLKDQAAAKRLKLRAA